MLTLLLLVIVAGVLAGLAAGLLGVGGGIVIVPVLYHVLLSQGFDDGMAMKLAVGTSLATIIPTSISSMRSHYRRGGVDSDLVRAWGPWVATGAIAGALLAAVVHGQFLTAVFAIVALLVAGHMTFTPEGTHLRKSVPTGWARALIASSIGGISTLMGIGGGTLTVPTLSLCSYPIRRAVGTASVMGLIIAIPGTIGFALGGIGVEGRPPYSLGWVNLIAFAVLVPLMVFMAPIGASLAHRMPTNALRKVFALFLFVTSIRMILRLVG